MVVMWPLTRNARLAVFVLRCEIVLWIIVGCARVSFVAVWFMRPPDHRGEELEAYQLLMGDEPVYMLMAAGVGCTLSIVAGVFIFFFAHHHSF